MPPVDQAIGSPHFRTSMNAGLLDSTLVMVTSEIWPHPRKLMALDGRDHWPRVFSVGLAGGGLQRGLVHGSSDALGGEPEEDMVGIQDLATTVYNQLGNHGGQRAYGPWRSPHRNRRRRSSF